MYFQSIVLHCHQKMQQDRSISATYYLLQGKPSIQTIQDGQIYQLNKYFGIYKHLSKVRFFEIVEQLARERLIEKQTEDNFYQITSQGVNWIKQSELTPIFLEGTRYKDIDSHFFDRILLFIQVFTNRKMNHSKYIPIIDNILVENWVKSYYQKWRNSPGSILKTLYDELLAILSPLPDFASEVFVDQLTSYKRIGLTMEQIAQSLEMSIESVYMIHVNTIHYLLKTIQSNKEQYPLLSELTHDLFQQKSFLTKSTKLTKQLLNDGLDVMEIAERRGLQLNTVYDHIVEIAVKEDSFSINPYVREQVQEEIAQAIQHIQSYKLKEIKNEVHEEVTYFQIRLVIAKLDNES